MGAAKLAIKTKYQVGYQDNEQDKNSPDDQALLDFFPNKPSSPPVSRGISDLVHLKSIGEFAFIFFHGDITEFIIDKEGIIAVGPYPKINDQDAGVAIDQEVSGVVSMKQAYFMERTIISYICPGHLAHKNGRNTAEERYNIPIIS